MDANLRNLKDFLKLYNKLTEICFSRCIDSLSERDLLGHENSCVDSCVNKFTRFNQHMMSVYVEVQTTINQKRVEELEESQRQEVKSSITPGASSQPFQPTTGIPLPS